MAISFMDTTNFQIVEQIAGSFSRFFTRAAAIRLQTESSRISRLNRNTPNTKYLLNASND